MTGFATKTVQIPITAQFKVGAMLHLKTLNSRYFEVNCKLPSAFSHLETVYVKLFKEHFTRGSVYFTIHLDSPAALKTDVAPALPTIANYIKAVKQIKKEFDFDDEITLAQLLTLPNIFTIAEKPVQKKIDLLMINAAKQLAVTVNKERKKEGAVLRADLDDRIKIMHKEISAIEKASTALVEKEREKIEELVKLAAINETEQAELRKSSLYAIIDKIAIHEEIVRFKNHLVNLRAILQSAEVEKGKRIDFTLQELTREINTISAKCSEFSTLAINIKVEAEKAREQTQNIV